MNKKTLTALRKSIAHWEENLAAKHYFEIGLGTEDCPLCQLFFRRPNRCVGCPVFENTKRNGCGGTPYDVAYNAAREWLSDNSKTRRWRNACRAEIKFLKSLLPEDKGNA